MKSLLPFALFILAIGPLACGKKENFAGSASVSGKVLWDENPLFFGSVQFYGAELFHTALIQKDGSYKLEHLPEGPVTVCIRLRGELYADSRGDVLMKQQMLSGKGKSELPEGMSMEEFKQKIMAQGGMKIKPGMAKSGIPAMRKAPRDFEYMPLVNGTPLIFVKEMPVQALMKLGEVHDKYGEFTKSPLTYTVLAGTQTHDIILK